MTTIDEAAWDDPGHPRDHVQRAAQATRAAVQEALARRDGTNEPAGLLALRTAALDRVSRENEQLRARIKELESVPPAEGRFARYGRTFDELNSRLVEREAGQVYWDGLQ